MQRKNAFWRDCPNNPKPTNLSRREVQQLRQELLQKRQGQQGPATRPAGPNAPTYASVAGQGTSSTWRPSQTNGPSWQSGSGPGPSQVWRPSGPTGNVPPVSHTNNQWQSSQTVHPRRSNEQGNFQANVGSGPSTGQRVRFDERSKNASPSRWRRQ